MIKMWHPVRPICKWQHVVWIIKLCKYSRQWLKFKISLSLHTRPFVKQREAKKSRVSRILWIIEGLDLEFCFFMNSVYVFFSDSPANSTLSWRFLLNFQSFFQCSGFIPGESIISWSQNLGPDPNYFVKDSEITTKFSILYNFVFIDILHLWQRIFVQWPQTLRQIRN